MMFPKLSTVAHPLLPAPSITFVYGRMMLLLVWAAPVNGDEVTALVPEAEVLIVRVPWSLRVQVFPRVKVRLVALLGVSRMVLAPALTVTLPKVWLLVVLPLPLKLSV